MLWQYKGLKSHIPGNLEGSMYAQGLGHAHQIHKTM